MQANINHEVGKSTCNNPESIQIFRIVAFISASNKEKLLLIKPLKLSIGFYFSITMKILTLMYFLRIMNNMNQRNEIVPFGCDQSTIYLFIRFLFSDPDSYYACAAIFETESKMINYSASNNL